MARRKQPDNSSTPSLPKVPPAMEVPLLRGLVSQLIEAVHRLQVRMDRLQATLDRLERPSRRPNARRSEPASR